MSARAFFLGGSWYFLPFWIFVPIACFFYFIPLFHRAKLVVPFIAILVLGALFPQNAIGAVSFGVMWFLLLGIRDLLFIDRAVVYEILSFLLLVFASLVLFHGVAQVGVSSWLVGWAALTLLFFLLLRGFLDYAGAERNGRLLVAGIFALLFWQWSVVTLLLPFHFMAQTALLFLFGAALIEFAFHYLGGTFTPKKAAVTGSVFLAAVFVMFLISRWGL